VIITKTIGKMGSVLSFLSVSKQLVETSRKQFEPIPGAELVEYEFYSNSYLGESKAPDMKREFLLFLAPSVKAHLAQPASTPLPLFICLPGTDT